MVRVAPVSTFLMVIVTPGTTAPDGSVTLPKIVPDIVCATATWEQIAQHNMTSTIIEARRSRLFIISPQCGLAIPSSHQARGCLEGSLKGRYWCSLIRVFGSFWADRLKLGPTRENYRVDALIPRCEMWRSRSQH